MFQATGEALPATGYHQRLGRRDGIHLEGHVNDHVISTDDEPG